MTRRLLVVPCALVAAAVWANWPADDFDPDVALNLPLVDASVGTTTAPRAWVAPSAPPLAATEINRQIEGSLGRTQTVASALGDAGLTPPQVAEAIASLREVFDFRTARAGARFTVEVTVDDARLDYVLLENGSRDRIEATRDRDQPLVARRANLPVETRLEAVGGEIQGSLYASLQRLGESPELAAVLADVFAWDIDFYRDQHPGDRFRVLVEKQYADDHLIGYGRVLAAEYDGRVGTHRTFWFAPGGNEKAADYYLQDGRSARKLFLATPLQYTRVSSSFSYNRRHPILGYNRAHLGVDYAAARGTPVRAMASGTVVLAGRAGGSGNLVKIRHRGGLVSAYAHLHRIAPGIRAGTQVTQKQTIGTVGSTGYATGPHLHFAVIKDGKHVNPQKLEMSRLESVAKAQRPQFEQMVAERVEALAQVQIGDDPMAIASLMTDPGLDGSRPSFD